MLNAVFDTGIHSPNGIRSAWSKHKRGIMVGLASAVVMLVLTGCGGFSTTSPTGEMSVPQAVTPGVGGASGAIHTLNGNLVW